MNSIYNNSQFLQAIIQTIETFAMESNLHGIKYIFNDFKDFKNCQSNQGRLRKLISFTIWLNACVLGAAFAIVLIGLIWNRFQTTPTITTIETYNYPIWNVPFPAVTLCNINKVYAPASVNITEKLIAGGIEKNTVTDFFSNLSKLIIPQYIDATYINIYLMLEGFGYTTEELMYELMQPCDELIKACFWHGKPVDCKKFFRVAKSTSGFCCSFNYKSLKDSLEVNLSDEKHTNKVDDTVYHVSGSGDFVGLHVILEIQENTYIANTKPFYGVEILIHKPDEFPELSHITAIGQPNYDLSIAVSPSVIVSEKSIRGLPFQQRNCIFDDEVTLRTTQKYSYQSCITECTVDNIIAICGCIPFYYPELHIPKFVKLYPQCTLNDAKCLRDNRHVFASLQPPKNISGLDVDDDAKIGMICNCMPSCSEESYEVQTILTKRTRYSQLISPVYYTENEIINSTAVNVHFKDISCIKYRRDMYMTWDGLFASFGGIFGLCLGGSVLSLVEIFYYFTFRLYSRYKAIKRKLNTTNLHNKNNKLSTLQLYNENNFKIY